MKLERPCSICQKIGLQKSRCCICGWKKEKEARPQKDTDEERRLKEREDFIGSIYNQMRTYRMESTGKYGMFEGRRVLVGERRVETDEEGVFIQIIELDTNQKRLVRPEKVTDIGINHIDKEIKKKFGDPLSPSAQPYIPHYKPKKNEV